MLLSYNELLGLQSNNVITNSLPKHVNQTSIDITLGRYIMYEDGADTTRNILTLANRDALPMKQWDLEVNGPFRLYPDMFILAQSEQEFNLPNNISCEYKLKSSMGRIALEHMNAGWCDAGWHDSVLTLEFKNMSQYRIIQLAKGDRIGQVVFFSHLAVPNNASYAAKGTYNNDKFVSGAKPNVNI